MFEWPTFQLLSTDWDYLFASHVVFYKFQQTENDYVGDRPYPLGKVYIPFHCQPLRAALQSRQSFVEKRAYMISAAAAYEQRAAGVAEASR